MTAEIKQLPNPEREECKQNAIKLLEETLEKARSGEIIAVGIAAVTPDLGCQTSWSNTDNSVVMLGALGVLQARIQSGLI